MIVMFCAVNDPDFKAGVASLAQLLQIPPHADHLVVLKVFVCFVEFTLNIPQLSHIDSRLLRFYARCY